MKTAAFFTDPTVCIGCKACEVACKEWNQLPDDGLEWSGFSYDNTRHLGASTWRHVSFLEQKQPLGQQSTGTQEPFRWIFMSDVCKTLRERGLSGGVSYGRDCAHRGRFSICAARRLQRLRALRGFLSFWCN
jgi:hypothetical protein